MTQGQAFLAHGLGGSSDLPIPVTWALIGAAWALTITFAVVAFAWRQPRFDPARPPRQLPVWLTRAVDAAATRNVIAAVSLIFAVWVLIAGWFGPQNADNALPAVFYTLLWVGLVAASMLIGPIWRVVSPMRTLHRVAARSLQARRPYPPSWGYYPAAGGLFAFVWLELASPDPGSVAAIKVWLLCYAVAMLAGSVIFGEGWFSRGDPFEVYSDTVSRLAPFRRDAATGRIGIGNPFDHLPSLPVRPGLVAVLATLLGSTAFDSFSGIPRWRNFVDAVSGESVAIATATRTAGLLAFVLVVAVTFTLAARATGGVDEQRRRALPGEMAHSLIPIVVGYVLAHYLSYLVERGQQAVFALADPLGRGWNLLGLAEAETTYFLSSHPSVLATLKVALVVAGHVAAVVAAHDRALRLLPKAHQLTGQLAMMLVMVFYTFMGLYLLFGG